LRLFKARKVPRLPTSQKRETDSVCNYFWPAEAPFCRPFLLGVKEVQEVRNWGSRLVSEQPFTQKESALQFPRAARPGAEISYPISNLNQAPSLLCPRFAALLETAACAESSQTTGYFTTSLTCTVFVVIPEVPVMVTV
jgi:hypothetical protein